MDKDGKMSTIEFIKGVKFTPWEMVDGKPLAVVLHAGATTGQGIVDTFLNPRALGSAHYVVFEDGSIKQMVQEQFVAWHAGPSQYPGFPNDYPEGHRHHVPGRPWNSLNVCTLGIELAGPPLSIEQIEWPEKLLLGTIGLLKDIKDRYPWIKLLDHWAICEKGKPWSRDDLRGYKGLNKFPWQRVVLESGIEEA